MDYDKKLEKSIKRNEKHLKEFDKWLKDKNLSPKTIRKHLSNASLYINDYLNYYEFTKMEDGISEVYGFLGDWFIRKCLWSSKNSIKETASSIKKFYECMCEKGYVSNEDYKFLCQSIKDNMDIFLESMDEYDNLVYDDNYDDLF